MKYLKKFNESLTEDEYNRILDKISELGINSLSSDEKSKLDNFNGTFDKDRNNDVIITTDHGTWTSNDINPKYLSDDLKDKDKGSVYDDSKRERKPNDSKSGNKSNDTPEKKPKKYSNLNSELSARWDGGKGFNVLHKDDNIIVVSEKYILNVCRVYYVFFKKLDFDNRCKVLKLEYDLRMSQRRDNSNITFSDNNLTSFPFQKLDIILNENGLDFGDFNTAWFYIEDNFNNK